MPLFHVLAGVLELKEATEHHSFLQLHDGAQRTPSPGHSSSGSCSRLGGLLSSAPTPRRTWGPCGSPKSRMGCPDAQVSDTRGRPRSLPHIPSDRDPEGRGAQPTCWMLIKSTCAEVTVIATTGRNLIPGLLSLTAQ